MALEASCHQLTVVEDGPLAILLDVANIMPARGVASNVADETDLAGIRHQEQQEREQELTRSYCG
eukprot:747500-Hanusia_phi.AAC.2